MMNLVILFHLLLLFLTTFIHVGHSKNLLLYNNETTATNKNFPVDFVGGYHEFAAAHKRLARAVDYIDADSLIEEDPAGPSTSQQLPRIRFRSDRVELASHAQQDRPTGIVDPTDAFLPLARPGATWGLHSFRLVPLPGAQGRDMDVEHLDQEIRQMGGGDPTMRYLNPPPLPMPEPVGFPELPGYSEAVNMPNPLAHLDPELPGYAYKLSRTEKLKMQANRVKTAVSNLFSRTHATEAGGPSTSARHAEVPPPPPTVSRSRWYLERSRSRSTEGSRRSSSASSGGRRG